MKTPARRSTKKDTETKMPVRQSNIRRAFVDARFVQQRVVSESITSPPSRPSVTARQLQIRAEVGSNFSVGLDNPEKPTEMFIEAEFRVVLKLLEEEKDFVSYLAKHTAHFKIVGWSGFDEWSTIPEGALGPYFSMTYGMVQLRAEQTLLDMGLRGVALPRANNFDEYSDSRATGFAVPAIVK